MVNVFYYEPTDRACHMSYYQLIDVYMTVLLMERHFIVHIGVV